MTTLYIIGSIETSLCFPVKDIQIDYSHHTLSVPVKPIIENKGIRFAQYYKQCNDDDDIAVFYLSIYVESWYMHYAVQKLEVIGVNTDLLFHKNTEEDAQVLINSDGTELYLSEQYHLMFEHNDMQTILNVVSSLDTVYIDDWGMLKHLDGEIMTYLHQMKLKEVSIIVNARTFLALGWNKQLFLQFIFLFDYIIISEHDICSLLEVSDIGRILYILSEIPHGVIIIMTEQCGIIIIYSDNSYYAHIAYLPIENYIYNPDVCAGLVNGIQKSLCHDELLRYVHQQILHMDNIQKKLQYIMQHEKNNERKTIRLLRRLDVWFHHTPVNKQDKTPVYLQVKEDIIFLIEKICILLPNTILPSEEELCEIYGVSRTVIRQAMTQLQNENYIYKQQGVGVFVNALSTSSVISDYCLFNFLIDLQNQGSIIDIEILNFEIIVCDEHRSKQFHCDLGTPFGRSIIAYKQNDEVIMLEELFLHVDYFMSLSEQTMSMLLRQGRNSVATYLYEHHSIIFSDIYEELKIVDNTHSLAYYFNQITSDTMFIGLFRQSLYETTLLEHSESIVRTDKFIYRNNM